MVQPTELKHQMEIKAYVQVQENRPLAPSFLNPPSCRGFCTLYTGCL